IGAGGLLVDQELHLHIDPAVAPAQALDLRHVAQIGAVHGGTGHLLRKFFLGCLHGFSQGPPDFFEIHHCPPSRRYTSCATTKSLPSMPSPRHAFIISLAAAASGTGLPSLRPRSSARIMSFCCS